jgi:hypothetical protein
MLYGAGYHSSNPLHEKSAGQLDMTTDSYGHGGGGDRQTQSAARG